MKDQYSKPVKATGRIIAMYE